MTYATHFDLLHDDTRASWRWILIGIFLLLTTAASVTYTPNTLDQYTAIGGATPTYDGNGNLTFDGTTTYTYDAENRLLTVSVGGTTIATYAYDALGRRKSQTVSGTTTIHVTDADNNALLDYASTGGAVQQWYAWGQDTNTLLNQVNAAAGTRATLIADSLGSIIGSLASNTGTLTKAGFQTYGVSTSTANNTFGYTGSRIAVGGLYDMRARFYSPTIGRFLSTDPIGTSGGVNLYAYVGNDPLNFTDPSGLAAENIGGFGANAAYGIARGIGDVVSVAASPFVPNRAYAMTTDPEFDNGTEGARSIRNGGSTSIIPTQAAGPMGGGSASSAANASNLSQQLTVQSAKSPFTTTGELTSNAISNSKPIPNLGPGQLNNPNIPPGFGKYTTPTYQSPSGNFQTHFYQNPATGEVNYNFDYKTIFNNPLGTTR